MSERELTEAQRAMMKTPIGRAQQEADAKKRRPKPPKSALALAEAAEQARIDRRHREMRAEFYARDAARRAA